MEILKKNGNILKNGNNKQIQKAQKDWKEV